MQNDNNILYCKGKKEEYVNIEFVREEISKYLQMDNLNFLIGAGCSSYFESDVQKGISGMKDLYKGFFEENKTFTLSKKNVEDKFDYNLERMLEVMGAINVISDVKNIDSKIEKKIKLVQNYINRKVKDGCHGEKLKDLYKEFYMKTVRKGNQSPINIFTTNYDVYNEEALDSLGYPYNNGFIGAYKRTFNPLSYKYAYVENMNLSQDVWNRVPNFYNLYKLHGSITWVKQGSQIAELDYNNISEDENLMIYPTPLKDRSTLMTPYSDLFRAMENTLLRENSVLVVLGYSFSDDHINRLILNALAIHTYRLIIFGESENISKLKDMNDKRIIIINSEDKIHHFENFVNLVMPELDEDIKEHINVKEVKEIINKVFGDSNEE